jgi:hypothetical protein
MLTRRICALLAVAALSASALAAGTVSFILESPQAGTNVAPGAIIDWTIKVSVSTGDNVGLALFACDLTQDAANPEKFDLPYGNAASIPAALAKFNRPLGITNPGEAGNPSGYVGVQRGTAGAKNLVQIGGAQNTFGTAMASGSGIAENAVVTGGVGQSGQQIVLSGSFTAPATTGAYTFRLENALANVLTSVATPPAYSPVTAATVNVAGASFTFNVQSAPAYCLGDLNCDGVVSFGDINPFVLYLSNYATWQTTYAGCNPKNGDINDDGAYPGFGDINPFVTLLSTSSLPITCP